MMPKKNYDLTEITRLLLEMRENCIPKAGNAYDDQKRTEKYDALNAAIDLINNPSLLTRWISVKDRLPDIDAEVLIYAGTGFYDVAQYSGGDRFWTLERNPECWVTVPEVTHWMPLPEPPKEESK